MTVEMEVKLARLKSRFRERALEDAGELKVLAEGLATSENKAIDRETIRHLAHRLAGSAGTFGFSQLTESAAKLEDLTLSSATEAELRDLTLQMVNAIHTTIQPGGPTVGAPERQQAPSALRPASRADT